MANKVATGTGELAADSGKRPSSTLYVLIALATVGVAAIAYRILSKGPKEHKQELIDRKDQNSNFTKQIAVEPGEEITDRNNDEEQSSPDDSICETGRESLSDATKANPVVCSMSMRSSIGTMTSRDEPIDMPTENSENIHELARIDAARQEQHKKSTAQNEPETEQSPSKVTKHFSTSTVGKRVNSSTVRRKRKMSKKFKDTESMLAKQSSSKEILRSSVSKQKIQRKSRKKKSSEVSLASTMLSRMTHKSHVSARREPSLTSTRLTFIKPKKRPTYTTLGMGPVHFIFRAKRADGSRPKSLGEIISRYKWKVSNRKQLQ